MGVSDTSEGEVGNEFENMEMDSKSAQRIIRPQISSHNFPSPPWSKTRGFFSKGYDPETF